MSFRLFLAYSVSLTLSWNLIASANPDGHDSGNPTSSASQGHLKNNGNDPFSFLLNAGPPEILREVASNDPVPDNITVRRVVFRSRNESEVFAIIAAPKAAGKHPGLLVLHGGGGSAEVDKAMAWAQRGYVAVAPDMPGIGNPEQLTHTKGAWDGLKYGEGRWTADPEAGASILVDAVGSAMKALELLRAQPDVNPDRIGVVGISWGGYVTTMVCGLAGSKVQAGFSIFGCGFYELTSAWGNLKKLPEAELDRWLKGLDAGRRAPGITAPFFIAGATNDFFYFPKAVQATLDAVPGGKNHLYAPNANHKMPVPGGMDFPKGPTEPSRPTAFQPFPTPHGSKANWLAMEVPYFDFFLKGIGEPLPKVTVIKTDDPLLAAFEVATTRPLSSVEVYWAKMNPDVKTREWIAIPATKTPSGTFEASLPPDAADWFALVSDDRPVTVSGNLISRAPERASKTNSLQ